MRKVLLAVVLVCTGCVSEETRQLARGVADYQARQAVIVGKLADYAKDRGALTAEEHEKVVGGQTGLTEATRSLSEILGKPKTPVEVDSW